MKYYICDVCGYIYMSDSIHNGFDCIHCQGKIIEPTKEYCEELTNSFVYAETTTISC